MSETEKTAHNFAREIYDWRNDPKGFGKGVDLLFSIENFLKDLPGDPVILREERDEARHGIDSAHAVLDTLGVRREDVTKDGIFENVVEYPVCDRIRFLVDQIERLWPPSIAMPFQDKINELLELDLSGVVIAVDFDGTCVMHDFPKVGIDVPGAVDVLRAIYLAGAELVVWTIRSDQAKIKNDPHSLADGTAGEELDREFLLKAVEWFTDRGITPHGVNCNPQQAEWSSSPKCYAHAYIDDAALGCPLIYDKKAHSRPYVDWDAMASLLLKRFTPTVNTEQV